MADAYNIQLNTLPHQYSFLQLQNQGVAYPLLVGGYGCGKTRTIAIAALERQLKYKGLTGAIFEPTYGAIRDVIVPALNEIYDEYGIYHRWNKNDNDYTTPFGKIMLRSMHDPDAIVGYKVAWAYADELDTMPHAKAQLAWERIIARARMPLPDGSQNIVGAVTTPEGFKFCYQNWVENPSKNHRYVRGETISALNAGFLSQGYVDNLIGSYTKEMQKAYLQGYFVNLNNASFYYGFTDDNVGNVPIDENLPINIGFDFNVNPAVACIIQDRNEDDIRVPATIFLRNSNTREVCDAIKEKLKFFRDSDVIIYGDASGASRDTRSSLSDYAIIEEELKPFFNSFTFRVPAKNPPIRDRENAVNRLLQQNKIKVDSTNSELIRDFRQIARKNNEMDKSNPELTHISDAFGYFISTKYPIKRNLKKEPRAL